MSYPHHIWFWIADQEPPADEEAPRAAEAQAKPAPQACPEYWRTDPMVPERAMEAVRAMCGGIA